MAELSPGELSADEVTVVDTVLRKSGRLVSTAPETAVERMNRLREEAEERWPTSKIWRVWWER